jgi:hypothetical protein
VPNISFQKNLSDFARLGVDIERLFDGVTVIVCPRAATRQNEGLTLNVLLTGGALFGANITGCVLSFGGSVTSRLLGRFRGLSAHMAMAQRGFETLRTWRMMEIGAITLVLIHAGRALVVVFVKSVGLTLGIPDLLRWGRTRQILLTGNRRPLSQS